AAAACGWAAAAALAGMMLVTVADVLLRAALNRPIRGTLEIIELLLACTFFLALPASFLRDEHIVVDIVDSFAKGWVPLLRRLAGMLGVVLMAVMAWQGSIAARDTLLFNDVTSDLSLPRIWYWIPVLAGMIGGCVAAAAMLVKGARKE
ncbi:MAG: TRAP transporter small permease, partial [Candidatus Parcubacteria bacterium]|nr:TRAP transporter small permease [Burkholderiales bacterium]